MASLHSFAYVNWKQRSERRASQPPARTMADFAKLSQDRPLTTQERFQQLYQEELKRGR